MANITISIDQNDKNLLAERHLSASRIFRRAMYQVRAGQLDIDANILIDPIEEIIKLRNIIKAQNEAYKEMADQLRRERAAADPLE